MRKGETEDLYITDMTSHGMGVARGADGAAVFVRGALPGDTVAARCYRAKKRYCEAEMVEIVSPSPDRQESFCALGSISSPVQASKSSAHVSTADDSCSVGACGGCQYCELRYEKQLELKRRQLVQDLIRIGGLNDPEVDPVIGMDQPFHYRNKVTFQVGWKGAEPAVGFYRAGSHEVVDCKECMIQAEPASATAAALRDFMRSEQISCFDGKTGKGLLKDMIVRSCFATGEVMVVLEINGSSIPGADRLIDMIDEQINSLSFDEGGYEDSQPSDNVGTAEGAEEQSIGWTLESVYMIGTSEVPVLLAGRKTVSEVLGGVKFEISPTSFYQVNPAQAVRLYDKVFEYAALSPGDALLDLYCGVGSIGLYLEDRMDDTVSVLGIESNHGAVLDANRNAVINSVINARYLCGNAEELLPALMDEISNADEHETAAGEHDTGADEHDAAAEGFSAGNEEDGAYDNADEQYFTRVIQNANVVILDPPRAGCDENLLAAVSQVSPDRIVYVSCDPATLARDVKYLTANGYEFIKATPVDMFPHTGHVETVCLMSRVEGK